MPIHRIIFRIDYKAKFEIMNAPGTVMSILNGDDPEFWQEFQDSTQTRLITGAFNKDGRLRKLSIDPTTIHFEIELVDGVELVKLEDDKDYREVFKRVKALCTHFNIGELRRAGIRFFHFNNIGAEGLNINSLFGSFYSPTLLTAIQNTVGKPSDYGIAIDGSHADGTKYHLKFGPYSKHDESKRFLTVGKVNANFICDIDIYEENFAFANSNPAGWARPLIGKAREVIDQLINELSESLPAETKRL